MKYIVDLRKKNYIFVIKWPSEPTRLTHQPVVDRNRFKFCESDWIDPLSDQSVVDRVWPGRTTHFDNSN